MQALYGRLVAPSGCAGQSALSPLGLLQDSMKGLKELSSRVCPPGDGPRLVACLDVSGVVARIWDSVWGSGGPWVRGSPDVASPGVPVSLRCAWDLDGAVPA